MLLSLLASSSLSSQKADRIKVWRMSLEVLWTQQSHVLAQLHGKLRNVLQVCVWRRNGNLLSQSATCENGHSHPSVSGRTTCVQNKNEEERNHERSWKKPQMGGQSLRRSQKISHERGFRKERAGNHCSKVKVRTDPHLLASYKENFLQC